MPPTWTRGQTKTALVLGGCEAVSGALMWLESVRVADLGALG